MRTVVSVFSAVGLLAWGSVLWAASLGDDPYVGCVYPAGGRQGSVFQVTVQGQRLRGASEVRVSGEGVRARVLDYVGPSGPLNQAQQQELRRRLQEIRSRRTGIAPVAKTKKTTAAGQKLADGGQEKPVVLPDLPDLRNLEQQTPMQLLRLADKYLNANKRPKAPIAERVTLEVTVDASALPGFRELRLRTQVGLSNPLVFQVGRFAELTEPDVNEEAKSQPPVQTPITLNGRIMPGEVDRHRVQLPAGRQLIAAVEARSLIPYLADAVPGWFQPILTIYDPDGKEIAFCDDCGFDPDPALSFKALKEGEHTLEIRDSVYRGRWDFVYRINIAEKSGRTDILPTGWRGGVNIGGTRPEPLVDRSLHNETEPNETGKTAVAVRLPQTLNGTIGKPGDKDLFRFEGKAGQTVVAEVIARRLGSPVDSLLRLLDDKGRIMAWNDDNDCVNVGLQTHQADSFLSARLSKAGVYYVQVSEAQGHGGSNYAYSLRISRPEPDFDLRISPSALNVTAGRQVVATVYVQRKDGWEGDVELSLKGTPAGFAINGGRIPKGKESVRLTLTAPLGSAGDPLPITIEGRASINGEIVAKTAIPVDNLMQAFAYQHLVSSRELLVAVTPSVRRLPVLAVDDPAPVTIPAGGKAEVAVAMRPFVPKAEVSFRLVDPPAGVTLNEAKKTRTGYSLMLQADGKQKSLSDNLIVLATTTTQPEPDATGATAKAIAIPLGTLPAIPVEIVRK